MLAEQGGQILGFVRTARRRVVEYAGEAEAVSALVRAVFERLDDPYLSATNRDSGNMPVLDASLRLVSPAYGTRLSHYLDELRIPRSREYLGMIRVIDPPGLMEECGLKGAAVTLEGESTTVSCRAKRPPSTRAAWPNSCAARSVYLPSVPICCLPCSISALGQGVARVWVSSPGGQK